MDTNIFIVYIKTDDIFKDIAKDVDTRFDTSNYELECSSIESLLPKGKNAKVIGLTPLASGFFAASYTTVSGFFEKYLQFQQRIA